MKNSTALLSYIQPIKEIGNTPIVSSKPFTVCCFFCFTLEWCIKILHERKIESGYGDSVVRRLSADLKERYPKMGVSPHQLWNMMKFYERYAGHDEKVLRSVALLPWSHNLLLLSKGLNDEATL